MKEITTEKQEVLKKHGFVPEAGHGAAYHFSSPTWVLYSGMIVSGDHADDYATVIYACEDTCTDGVLDGLFYSPSMLEYLLRDFRDEWDPQEILDHLCAVTNGKLMLVDIGGVPTVFTKIHDHRWERGELRYAVSDMLKAVGALDLLLTEKRRELIQKREQEQG